MVDNPNGRQSDLDRYGGGDPLGIPPEMAMDDPSEAFGIDPGRLGDRLERYGITPEVAGRPPSQVDSRWHTNLWRTQYFEEYLYDASSGDDDTEVAPIQFRTNIITVGQPSQTLLDYFDSPLSGRLKALFDTGEYDDYFSNWATQDRPFKGHHTNLEGPTEIGPDDANAVIGVPYFELELYDDEMNLRGEARGYIDPFDIGETRAPSAPQAVKWNIGFRSSRGSSGAYELKPVGNEERRLRGTNKMVFLNGEYIGRMQPAKNRGVYLRTEYKRPPTENGFTKRDRQWFIDAGVFHYNAIAKGGTVWKVGETAETINLVATKPDDWSGQSPGTVDVEATGISSLSVSLTPETPDRFVVRADNKISALGYYNPPVERLIDEIAEFWVQTDGDERPYKV